MGVTHGSEHSIGLPLVEMEAGRATLAENLVATLAGATGIARLFLQAFGVSPVAPEESAGPPPAVMRPAIVPAATPTPSTQPPRAFGSPDMLDTSAESDDVTRVVYRARRWLRAASFSLPARDILARCDALLPVIVRLHPVAARVLPADMDDILSDGLTVQGALACEMLQHARKVLARSSPWTARELAAHESLRSLCAVPLGMAIESTSPEGACSTIRGSPDVVRSLVALIRTVLPSGSVSVGEVRVNPAPVLDPVLDDRLEDVLHGHRHATRRQNRGSVILSEADILELQRLLVRDTQAVSRISSIRPTALTADRVVACCTLSAAQVTRVTSDLGVSRWESPGQTIRDDGGMQASSLSTMSLSSRSMTHSPLRGRTSAAPDLTADASSPRVVIARVDHLSRTTPGLVSLVSMPEAASRETLWYGASATGPSEQLELVAFVVTLADLVDPVPPSAGVLPSALIYVREAAGAAAIASFAADLSPGRASPSTTDDQPRGGSTPRTSQTERKWLCLPWWPPGHDPVDAASEGSTGHRSSRIHTVDEAPRYLGSLFVYSDSSSHDAHADAQHIHDMAQQLTERFVRGCNDADALAELALGSVKNYVRKAGDDSLPWCRSSSPTQLPFCMMSLRGLVSWGDHGKLVTLLDTGRTIHPGLVWQDDHSLPPALIAWAPHSGTRFNPPHHSPISSLMVDDRASPTEDRRHMSPARSLDGSPLSRYDPMRAPTRVSSPASSPDAGLLTTAEPQGRRALPHRRMWRDLTTSSDIAPVLPHIMERIESDAGPQLDFQRVDGDQSLISSAGLSEDMAARFQAADHEIEQILKGCAQSFKERAQVQAARQEAARQEAARQQAAAREAAEQEAAAAREAAEREAQPAPVVGAIPPAAAQQPAAGPPDAATRTIDPAWRDKMARIIEESRALHERASHLLHLRDTMGTSRWGADRESVRLYACVHRSICSSRL